MKAHQKLTESIKQAISKFESGEGVVVMDLAFSRFPDFKVDCSKHEKAGHIRSVNVTFTTK